MISSSSTTRIVPLREVAMAQLRPRAARRRCRRQRQRQREPRALPDRAVAANRAVVLAHDAVGDRQPEAGAAADRLGGEERIVDARQLLGRNARTGVGDFGDRRDRRRRASTPTASRRAASRRARSGTGSGTPAAAGARCRATGTGAGDSSRRTLMLADLELMLEQREHVGDDGVQVDVDPLVRRRCPAATGSAGR